MIKRVLPIILLIFGLLPNIYPLFQPVFFMTDDGNWMIVRLAAFFSTLREGQFPVRFIYNLNHGYGYPVTNFLYPLPFYIGSAFHLLGFNFIDSVKAVFGLSTVLGAMGFYLFIKKKTGHEISSLCSSLVYSYLPYRIFDLYHRGSLGEVVAFGFAPFVFWGWEKIKSEDKNGVFIASVSLGLLITSHNTLGLLFTGLFLALWLFELFYEKLSKKVILEGLVATGLAAGISCFFWAPALFELSYTRAPITEVAKVTDYFVTASNFPVIIGYQGVIALLLGAFLFIKKQRGTGIFWILAGSISLLMTTAISSPVWQITLFQKIIQFPWRLASVGVFAGAVITALIVKRQLLVGLLLTALVAILGIILISPNRTFYPDSYYSTNDDTTTVKNEYLPIWVKSEITSRPAQKFDFLPEDIVRANVVYYPGWKAFVNNREVPISFKDDGFIKFSAKPQDKIAIRFSETPLRVTADLVSVFSLILVLIYTLVKYLKRNLH